MQTWFKWCETVAGTALRALKQARLAVELEDDADSARGQRARRMRADARRMAECAGRTMLVAARMASGVFRWGTFARGGV